MVYRPISARVNAKCDCSVKARKRLSSAVGSVTPRGVLREDRPKREVNSYGRYPPELLSGRS